MSESSAEYLGPLLRTLAETLDVRQIFERLSARRILPHEFLITSDHLPLGVASAERREARAAAAPAVPAVRTIEATERDMIREALALAGNNKSKAARSRGLTRAQLRSRLEKHGLGT